MMPMRNVIANLAYTGHIVATQDIWGKIGAISGLISGILVALIGGIATYILAKRQRVAEDTRSNRELAVLRVQTVQAFISNLGSQDEREKEAALLAINALGNPELASRLAAIYGGEGSVAAMSRVAARSSGVEAAQAEESLAVLFDSLRAAVVFVSSPGTQSSGFVVASGRVVTTACATGESRLVQVRSRDAIDSPGKVLARDAARNLALLSMDTSNLPQLGLEVRPEGQYPFEEVTVVGYGHGHEQVQVGVVEGMILAPEPAILTRIESQPGFGGAPAFNNQGTVVGVVSELSPSAFSTFLIPAQTIRDFLVASGQQDIDDNVSGI
jgi:S1-C subfamily serine protease